MVSGLPRGSFSRVMPSPVVIAADAPNYLILMVASWFPRRLDVWLWTAIKLLPVPEPQRKTGVPVLRSAKGILGRAAPGKRLRNPFYPRRDARQKHQDTPPACQTYCLWI